MARFLILSLPLLVLVLALGGMVAEMSGASPRAATGADLGLWIVEAMGLTALFVLVHGRSARRWLDGVLVGWIAWLFRGPAAAMAVAIRAGGGALGADALPRLVLYTLCGLLMAAIARFLGLPR